MTDFGGYTMRNLKSCRGRDGIAWSADLYRDGRKVGTVIDSGNGGGVTIHDLPRAEQEALQAHVATLPPLIDNWRGQRHEYPQTCDSFLAALGDYTETMQRATKRARAMLRGPAVGIDAAGAVKSYRDARFTPLLAQRARDAYGLTLLDPTDAASVEKLAAALVAGAGSAA